MSTPMAMLRLVWRPLTLMYLTLIALVVIPLAGVEWLDLPRLLGEGAPPLPLRVALWHAAVLIPGTVGFALAEFRLEAQHLVLSWMVPGFRRGLLRGTLLMAGALALGFAALIARVSDASAGLAAFGVALAAFAAIGYAIDVAVWMPGRLLAFGGLATAVLRPGTLTDIAESYPLLTAAFALAAAVPLFGSITATDSARRRPFLWSGRYRPGARAQLWGKRRPADREWNRSLTTDALAAWVRAAAHESAFPREHLRWVLLAVVGVRLLGNPGLLPLLSAMFFVRNGLQLTPDLCYPLSRRRLANVTWVCMFIDGITYFAMGGALIFITGFIEWPTLPLVEESERATNVEWIISIGIGLAMLPIIQWGRIRWPRRRSQWKPPVIRAHFLRFIVYAVVITLATMRITMHFVEDGIATSMPRLGVTLLAAVAAGQLINWIALQVHYRRGDLVHMAASNPTGGIR